MIEPEKNKNQPFSRFYFDKPALHESKTKTFGEGEFKQILEIFFELYGFDPRYLVPVIQSVLDLASAAAYTAEGEVQVNLTYISSPYLLRTDRNLLASPWVSWKKHAVLRKFEESLRNGERSINEWSYARLLFHEVLHSVFEKGTVDLLINALHLDNAIFVKAKRSHYGIPFAVRLILDQVDNDEIIWKRLAVEEFKKRKKAYGEKYAVLVLYETYLSSLEELVIRIIDKLIADHFKIKKTGQEDYWALKEHEDISGPHPQRIRKYGSVIRYFYLPQNIIDDLTRKCEKTNLFNDDSKQIIFLVKEIIDEYFSFTSFKKCLQEVTPSNQILDAVIQLNDEVEAFSNECVQALSVEMYEFLEPYHQSFSSK
jgi:hypothetical protein